MPEAKPAASELAATAFIARWSAAGSAERANYALFLTELCALLDVPPPEPAGDDTAHNAYVFERAVPLHQRDRKATTGHIDLYKRGCFVLEAKQYAAAVAGVVDPGQPGSPSPATTSLAHLLEPAPEKKSKIARGSEAWDDAMLKARGQAERYARNLPAGEPTPPFLLVVDVGHVFELYADFSQQGKAYLPFPDARANRIRLADLQDANARAKLRAIWLEPLTLDPAKIAAAVTREVARYLAELAKLFEKKHDPALVAAFLSRCLFCMFAEDIDLLPRHSFTQLLESAKGDPGAAVPLLKGLFDEMNRGGYSLALRKTLLHFNGGLFAESAVLPLDGTQLGLLIDAAKKDWKHVEPAIFGTLLERALNPAERHKLGAHYTPRAYVERLVLPTLVEPLREEWEHVRAAAVTLAGRGDLKGAIKETRAFHHRLCAVRVPDPACGSGNFLYVALEHLKRLEGEVLQLIEGFGENMRLDLGGETVDPHQFLGIEINPRAATIAELVLWIGYLQWHHRNRGSTEWPEPVLRAFKNIECRDAVLAYDKKEFAQDAAGKMRFVWDRKTMKIDPATGREVPDDKAVVPLETFVNPRPAEWPQADFIVGNPPFVANRNMREELRDGYVDALDRAFADIEQAVDFVMLFWKHAARLLLNDSIRRFGLVSTSRIRQKQNRSVVEYAMASGSRIIFATPDHPWDEDQTEASVRIAMTVLGRRDRETQTIPHLLLAPDHDQVAKARPAGFYHPDAFRTIKGREIHADLSVDIDLSATRELRAWSELCHARMKPYAETLLITDEQATALFPKGVYKERHAPPYRNGQDIARRPRGLRVLDFFGLSESEIHQNFPKAYDYLVAHTKAERSQERNPRLKREWWLFEANRAELRSGIRGLDRYIVTVENSPTRYFCFLPAGILPDQKLRVFTTNDAFILGVLSTSMHDHFARRKGGRHGVGNTPVYNTECASHFPVPDCTEKQKAKIRALAEELDAHRKRAQAQHGIGLTDLYNVLEKIRRPSVGDAPPPARRSRAEVGAAPLLTEKEKLLHDQALVATLRQLHDDLDAAVADAYGWPWPLSDEDILARVVALNAARAAEEAQGQIRWLRPDYQKPLFAGEKQSSLGMEEPIAPDWKSGLRKKAAASRKTAKIPWPKTLSDRVRAVETVLAAEEKLATAADLAKRFARADAKDIGEILHTLVTLGRARPGDAKGTFVR